MRALTLSADGPKFRDDLPWPEPTGGEALLQLRLGGVCATDLELCAGYMGYQGVLGHEWVGVVLSAPDPSWNGARVVGGINAACGRCRRCEAGLGSHCPHRTVLGIDGRDGAFSERFLLPTANLLRVPDHVTDEQAVFVEPLAAACEILEQVHVLPSDVVVVLGAGRLGQLCARVLALTGADVHVVNRAEARLALLPEGIGRWLASSCEPLRGADIVVDCTGSPQGLSLATSLVRPRGTLVMKTTVHDGAPISSTPWVINELRVVGSRCGPFAPALRLLASAAVDPTPLITGRFPLHHGVEALRAAASAAHTKVLIHP